MDGGRRTRCHGNQSLSSPSSTFSRFSLFLRLLRSSSSVRTTGCIPPLLLLPPPSASTLLCLFPKRPMGLTPRPTYQNGSISGPRPHASAPSSSCIKACVHYLTAVWRQNSVWKNFGPYSKLFYIIG